VELDACDKAEGTPMTETRMVSRESLIKLFIRLSP